MTENIVELRPEENRAIRALGDGKVTVPRLSTAPDPEWAHKGITMYVLDEKFAGNMEWELQDTAHLCLAWSNYSIGIDIFCGLIRQGNACVGVILSAGSKLVCHIVREIDDPSNDAVAFFNTMIRDLLIAYCGPDDVIDVEGSDGKGKEHHQP